MKRNQIIACCIVGIIIVGLIIFASTRQFEDSHLRKEGKRIRMTSEILIVDEAEEETKNFTYSERTVKVGDKEAKMVFELINVNEKGYPTTATASINGTEFYRKNDLDIENDMENAYKIFLNFHELGKEYVVFTLTDSINSMSTTLYIVDLNGNIILEEKIVDDDNMTIKDYGDFIKFDSDTSFTIYASRLTDDVYYHSEHICDANGKAIVEAYYTYTYKNGKITKKQIKTTTAATYIKENEIVCRSED